MAAFCSSKVKVSGIAVEVSFTWAGKFLKVVDWKFFPKGKWKINSRVVVGWPDAISFGLWNLASSLPSMG
jgi:hypothetical protein